MAPAATAPDEEARRRKLLKAARRGDRGARERLVECHLPLVRALAGRYRNYGLPLDDLVQEGAIGLLEAVDRFDPGRGVPFEPYARFRIRRAIRNALTDQARLIRLPKQVVERRRTLERAEADLLASGCPATAAELAASTGLPLPAVLEARAVTTPVSLDRPVLLDGATLEGVVSDPAARDPAAQAIERAQEELVEQALDRLPERQRRILVELWGLRGRRARSATEIARELELSPRRTQTIGRDGLLALRRELELVAVERGRPGARQRATTRHADLWAIEAGS